MIWAWASFAAGYVLGGISGILVLGLFIVGGRGDAISEDQMPPETSLRNPVVSILSAQGARRAEPDSSHPKPPPDRSA